jgi:ribosome-binding protein aMBF1 (putative translation factor)
MKDIVERLRTAIKRKKISKWEISKCLNVQWQTVYSWQRGIYRPNEENEKALDEILKTTEM